MKRRIELEKKQREAETEHKNEELKLQFLEMIADQAAYYYRERLFGRAAFLCIYGLTHVKQDCEGLQALLASLEVKHLNVLQGLKQHFKITEYHKTKSDDDSDEAFDFERVKSMAEAVPDSIPAETPSSSLQDDSENDIEEEEIDVVNVSSDEEESLLGALKEPELEILQNFEQEELLEIQQQDIENVQEVESTSSESEIKGILSQQSDEEQGAPEKVQEVKDDPATKMENEFEGDAEVSENWF